MIRLKKVCFIIISTTVFYFLFMIAGTPKVQAVCTCPCGCSGSPAEGWDCDFCGGGGGGGDEGGTTSCFPAGTKVTLGDNSTKNIEDVKVGDKVLSEAYNGKESVSAVVGLVTPIRDSMCTVEFKDGDSLELTSEHPLFTQKGWRSINPVATIQEISGLGAKALEVGNKVVKIGGSYGEVSSIACRSEKIQAYNLQLNQSGVSTYFANGYLAHNVKCRCQDQSGECTRKCCGQDNCPGAGGGTTPSCDNNPPENLSPTLSRIDGNTIGAIFTWNSGSGNDFQSIAATTNWDEYYDNDCRTGIGLNFPCAFIEGDLPQNQEKYPLTGMENLKADTTYVAIVNGYLDGGDCFDGSQTTFITSCNFPPISIVEGQIGTLELKLNADTTTVDRVNFSVPAGTTAITLPSRKYVETSGSGSSSYIINVQANSPTTSPITVTAQIRDWENTFNVATCQTQVSVTPSAVDAWWQVKDSDLQSGGGISSSVPTGNYFDLIGSGGYPGIPVYSDPLNLGQATGVSTKGWIAQSLVSSTKLYDYQSLVNLIPDDIKTGYIYPITSDSLIGAQADTNGYEWYKYTGPVDLNINSALNFGSRKVILLVENANLNINQNVDLTNNGGFFLAIVNGNIKIDPAVTSLKGLYVADSGISTGTGGTKTDSALTLRGSLAAYGTGLKLERQLANNSNPAEFFEFAPDQFIRFPSVLGIKRTSWKEVAP